MIREINGRVEETFEFSKGAYNLSYAPVVPGTFKMHGLLKTVEWIPFCDEGGEICWSESVIGNINYVTGKLDIPIAGDSPVRVTYERKKIYA